MATKKPPMSDAERAELSARLDAELEEYMDTLAAQRKDEEKEKKPFDFEQWSKEIDAHPAFMKNAQDLQKAAGGQYAEQLEALKALKEDQGDTEEEKVANAEGYKKDGNRNFGLKKYRWAIEAYTNGLKVKCLDRTLNSQLYGNRAAAQVHLGNKRMAIKDCATSLRFDPQNLKAATRGAECLLDLGYGGDAVKFIDGFLKNFLDEGEPLLKTIKELRAKAEKETESEERDRRKKRAEMAKDLVEKKKLLTALAERGLNLAPRLPFKAPELFEWSLIEVSIAQMKSHERVRINEQGHLEWPLLIQYPEVGMTDVITEVDETGMAGDLLKEVLASPAEWDADHKYKMENVSFFISDEYDEFLYEIYPWTDWKTAFSYPGVQIKKGLPCVMVYTNAKKDSDFTQVEEGVNKWVLK